MTTDGNKEEEERERGQPPERRGIIESLTEVVLDTNTFKEAFVRLLFLSSVAIVGVTVYTFYELRTDILGKILAPQDHNRWVLAQEENRVTRIPGMLESLKNQYGAKSVTLWAYHNGTQTLRMSAAYSSGLDVPLTELDGLPATLDNQVLSEFYWGNCVSGIMENSLWSVSSRRQAKRLGNYYNISCPVVVHSDLVGFISMSWDEQGYKEHVAQYPLEEILRDVRSLTHSIETCFSQNCET